MNWTEAYLLADMEAEEMMRAEETADRIKQLVAANEAQAAEIERLRGALERGLSVAKEIEKACRGLRDEAQPMTAKDATRLIIAALTGDKT